MIHLRPRGEREHARLDGLESFRTFPGTESHALEFPMDGNRFGSGFGDLRAINDVVLRPQAASETRMQQDTEVLTWVLQGTLAHKDSRGEGSLVQAGELLRMTAGTGVLHSEFNPSDLEAVHFLQLRIEPEVTGLAPEYEQRFFDASERVGRWQVLASRDGRDESVRVRQDVLVSAVALPYGGELGYSVPEGRMCWVQVVGGVVQLNGKLMEAGDGAAVEGEDVELESVSNQGDVLVVAVRKA